MHDADIHRLTWHQITFVKFQEELIQNRLSTNALRVLLTLDDVQRCIEALYIVERRCADVWAWAGSKDGMERLREADEACVRMMQAFVQWQEEVQEDDQMKMESPLAEEEESETESVVSHEKIDVGENHHWQEGSLWEDARAEETTFECEQRIKRSLEPQNDGLNSREGDGRVGAPEALHESPHKTKRRRTSIDSTETLVGRKCSDAKVEPQVRSQKDGHSEGCSPRQDHFEVRHIRESAAQFEDELTFNCIRVPVPSNSRAPNSDPNPRHRMKPVRSWAGILMNRT